MAPTSSAIHHSWIVPLASRHSEIPAGMRRPPITKVGTPISRLFVISTSACASVRAERRSASSRESSAASISRSQYRLRICTTTFFTCETTT
jgi:hypothetical protein